MAQRLTTLISQEFKGIDLGDERLNERCHNVAKAMSKNPERSIPENCEQWSSTKAAYRFFSHESTTRESLLEPHIQHTIERCDGRKDVVIIHDTTHLHFTSYESIEGLGAVGTTEEKQGLMVHNTLAVDASNGEILGLLNQEVWAREKRRSKGETISQRRLRERESQRWPRAMEVIHKMNLPQAIHVADREGDIYEVLRDLNQRESRYVIRAARNRLLGNKEGYLFESVRQAAVVGTMSVFVSARAGQKERTALLTLRRKKVSLCSPVALRRRGEEVTVNVVEAYEHHVPKGCARLHWILLTSEPVETLEQSIHVISLYKSRWKIEEFHMSLKTGCGIENRQLKTRKRLEVVLGLYSVIGVMLLRLRDVARGSGSAREFLSEIQIKLLRNRYPSLAANLTGRDAFRSMAKLGGFLARKGDGEPGWRTLWRGMEKLLLMEHAILLSQQFSFLTSKAN